jgi:hypothetical protein
MEQEITMPQRQGQVCRILNPLEDENPEDVYLVVEDPEPYGPEDMVYAVNLKELQRHVKKPQFAPQMAIAKNGLEVVADNLEAYIKGWNKPGK